MIRLFIACLALAVAFSATAARAGGKKKLQEPDGPKPLADGKRLIALQPIPNVRIELPDQDFHDFGEDFQARLHTKLTETGHFTIMDPVAKDPMARISRAGDLDIEWPSLPIPAATVRIDVEALTFQTGSRGTRMFYGFDERMKNPFNDGVSGLSNEFPLREIEFEPNWFDRSFDIQGVEPFDSASGLDLGEGIGINVLFAWLKLKYAGYKSELHLKLTIEAPFADRNEYRLVQVKGKGFFFDIVGGYMGYSGGIKLARRDAMLKAFNEAIDSASGTLDRALSDLPLIARIDGVVQDDGTILIATGHHSGVPAGTLFEVYGAPGTVVRVLGSNSSGSLGKVVLGDASAAAAGRILREIHALPSAPLVARAARGLASLASNDSNASNDSFVSRTLSRAPILAATETIELPSRRLKKPDLQGKEPDESSFGAFWKSLVESVFLPYRIYRYFSYDQTYHSEPDLIEDRTGRTENWAEENRTTAWARQIGMDLTHPDGASQISVAVIDSGVDYNHPAIHGSLWLNPLPDVKDRYGWDFISGDSRPYDDGYHGTQVASLVSAVAPGARIMPLKVFNPWGITSSAALLEAFRYASDHGAKIILCGWATRKYSKAIEMGVSYAREHGAVVVAAAGDRGDDLEVVPAYPAALSRSFDNVLTVTNVDSEDELVKSRGRYANFSPSLVDIAAPGKELEVAEPRNGYSRETSTGLSAAIVAGALARLGAAHANYSELIEKIREQAEPRPGLRSAVKDGLRLRIRD